MFGKFSNPLTIPAPPPPPINIWKISLLPQLFQPLPSPPPPLPSLLATKEYMEILEKVRNTIKTNLTVNLIY